MGPEGSHYQKTAYMFRGRTGSLGPPCSKASRLEGQLVLLSGGSDPRPEDLCQSKNLEEPWIPHGARLWGRGQLFHSKQKL